MTAYHPQDIADILMMRDFNAASAPEGRGNIPGRAQDTPKIITAGGTLSPYFSDLSSLNQIERPAHPRSLMHADRRLDELGFARWQIDQMAFPLLASFQHNFRERLNI